MLSIQRIVPPAAEPVTLEQAKAHCRIDGTEEDDLLTLYISAARQYVESRLDRSLVKQAWQLSLSSFPWGGYKYLPGSNAHRNSSEGYCDGMTIQLPKPPFLNVQSISYVNYNGTRVLLDPATYTVDVVSEPARIMLAPGKQWPVIDVYQPNGISIVYQAGYGDDGEFVPQSIILAILLLVGHFYNNREATSQGVNITTVPIAVDALLAGHVFSTFSYGS